MLSTQMMGLLLMVYGPPKRGKTVIGIRALCGPRVAYIGVRSAIELVAQTVCGFTPPWIEERVNTLPDLLAWLQLVGVPAVRSGALTGVFVDDFSLICSNSMALWDRQSGGNSHYPYKQLDFHLDTVGNAVRSLNLPCALSAHEVSPEPAKNKMGAPEVPSSKQVKAVPSWCDIVARVIPWPTSPDPLWPAAFWVDPLDTDWVTGDRYNLVGKGTPANLREILRASQAQLHLPRLPGLEWQDDVADKVAEEMLKGVPPFQLLEQTLAWTKAPPGSPAELQVVWALQDGIARGQLIQQKRGGLLARARMLDDARKVQAPPPVGGAPPPPGVPGVSSPPVMGPK